MVEKDCADVVRLRVLRWGDYLGLSAWGPGVKGVLVKGKQEGQRRGEAMTEPVWSPVRRGMSQETPMASPRASRRNAVLQPPCA